MVHEREQQQDEKKDALYAKERVKKEQLSPPSKPAVPVPEKADQGKKRDKKVRYQDNVDDGTEEMTMEELGNSFDKTRRNRLGLGHSSSNLNFDFNASYCSDGGIEDQSLTLVQLGQEQ